MSDLIGWHSMIVTPEMIGQNIAIYTAIEVKSGSRRPTIDQCTFIKLVRKAGGIAGVARSPEDAEEMLNGYDA